MALMPHGRWLDVTVEIEDVDPATGTTNIFALEQSFPRRLVIRLYSLANPPVRQTLGTFISSTRYHEQDSGWSGAGPFYEYQDFSTDRYPGGENPYGVVYMMFTKTTSGVYTQHLNRLTVNDQGVVSASDEFDFPSGSAYLICSVDQNVVYVLDPATNKRLIKAFTFPTSGAALVPI